jgi:hypothetical protein
MDKKNLLIASLAGAVTITALSNIPFINLVNCLLCGGFWFGSVLATWLYKRLTGAISVIDGVKIGALAGLFAGVLGFLLSLVNLAGLGSLIHSMGQFFPGDDTADIDTLLAGPFEMLFNLLGVLVNVAFGAVGGFIGGNIFKSRSQG